MTAANQSLVSLYEQGHTIDEISLIEKDYSIEAIKMVLMSCSAKYRSDMKQDKELAFTDTQEEGAIAAIAEIASYSEDEHNRLRAAIFIRNDKRGRLDVDNKSKNTFRGNIVQINQYFQLAKQRKEEARSKVIQLEPHERVILEKAAAKVI